MDACVLKAEIFKIKERLEKVQLDLENRIKILNQKEVEFTRFDEQASLIMRQYQNHIICFSVMNTRFMTKVETLLNTKDSLFYKMIVSGVVNLNETIFFDRNPKTFGIILNYLRTKRIELKRFNKNEINELHTEASYFEITELVNMIGKIQPKTPQIVGFRVNKPYEIKSENNESYQLNSTIDDLTNRNLCLGKGILAKAPGSITIELNGDWDIKTLIIRGFKNENWVSTDGEKGDIKVSLDGEKWTNVAKIPTGFANNFMPINFSEEIIAKFLKFESISNLGISYLNFKKLSK